MLQMDDEKLKELFYNDVTIRDIAKHFNCSVCTIHKRVKKLNLTREKLRFFEDITGQKFNKITAIKYIRLDKFGKAIWLFKCDCGREKELNASAAKANLTTSCGCVRQRTARKLGHGLLSHRWFKKLQKSARERNYEINLDMEYLWNLFLEQDEKCAISGVSLTIYPDSNKERLMTASLDRIDSNVGYIKGNVQWVHKRINRMKNVLSIEELKFWCIAILKNCEHIEVKDFDVNILTWD
jgi:hypothetical protein